MRRVVATLLILSLFVSTGVLCGELEQYQFCDDPLEILKSIKAYPDNYQQILNAFYAINLAKPSSVIIAYFTNYTDPFPEECSLGTYPWRTYPGINHNYHRIHWYMWTTAIIFDIASSMLLMEFGEYLPTITYYQLFNKTSPFVLPTQIACIKIPFERTCGEWKVLGTVTNQVGIQCAVKTNMWHRFFVCTYSSLILQTLRTNLHPFFAWTEQWFMNYVF